MPNASWQTFDQRLPVLTFEYSFGPGSATALAVGGAQGLIVVSPPSRAQPALFDDLARYGTVRALVAPNAYHTMGIAGWRSRFADADVFAPRQSIARVTRKSGVGNVRPLDEIAPLAGPAVRFVDMPHYKTGEALVEIDTSRGYAWYVTDVIFNMETLPGPLVVRTIFRLTGSAPGLRYNNVAPIFMVENRRALRQWIADEARRRRPKWIIPSHGSIADLEAQPEAAQRIFGDA